jgi:hypothetical protein
MKSKSKARAEPIAPDDPSDMVEVIEVETPNLYPDDVVVIEVDDSAEG